MFKPLRPLLFSVLTDTEQGLLVEYFTRDRFALRLPIEWALPSYLKIAEPVRRAGSFERKRVTEELLGKTIGSLQLQHLYRHLFFELKEEAVISHKIPIIRANFDMIEQHLSEVANYAFRAQIDLWLKSLITFVKIDSICAPSFLFIFNDVTRICLKIPNSIKLKLFDFILERHRAFKRVRDIAIADVYSYDYGNLFKQEAKLWPQGIGEGTLCYLSDCAGFGRVRVHPTHEILFLERFLHVLQAKLTYAQLEALLTFSDSQGWRSTAKQRKKMVELFGSIYLILLSEPRPDSFVKNYVSDRIALLRESIREEEPNA